MKKIFLLFLLCLVSFTFVGCKDEKEEVVEENKQVLLGIDTIDEHLDLFEGKRVGLITNATGLNSNYESTIDVLFEKVELTALFAPEHGIRGAAGAGDNVGNEIDPVTKLPIFSLYGSTQRPTKPMMDQIDIMCIDLQDVGARFYTFVYTMAKAMQACKQFNKPFVVFDRPNPISGNVVDGNILDTKYASFVGMYPITTRHGMTIGELAEYFNEEQNIHCDLTVIKMKNWKRDMYYDECGNLPWVLPSPNMPTLDTAIVYPGACIVEGLENVSEGRGTTRPFELIGAPFIDSLKFSEKLNSLGLKGVYFRPAAFTPSTSKLWGQTCYGVQIHVTNRDEFESVLTGVAIYKTLLELYPNDVKVRDANSEYNHMNRLMGCNYIKENKYSLDELREIFKTDCETFNLKRVNHLMYE